MLTEKEFVACKNNPDKPEVITEQESSDLKMLAEIICTILLKEIENPSYGEE